MSNDYYNASGTPGTGAFAASAPIRSEYTAIAAGFAKLPTLSAGTASKPVVVNPGGTALTTTTGTLALAGNFATTGAFATTLVAGADVSLTLPVVSGTLATLAGTETLSNKTLVSPVLGTPTSGDLSNCTGTASGLTAGHVTTNANLTGGVTSVGNAATVVTNANLTGVITSVGNATSIASQTGTGTKFVVDNGPTLIAPVLGVATATSLNGLTITTTTGTLTITAGKTLSVAKTLSFDGTDGTTMTFPSTSATIARTDAANTFTGVQTMTSPAITTPAFTGAFSGTYSLAGTPTINTTVAVGGTWTAAATWTLPALTLGGTVSGGGQQINNVVIGASTPLAGSFTTLSASGQITSTVATGSAPLVVASTTNVANLNASSLNGATFAAPGAIGSGTASTGAFTALTATTLNGNTFTTGTYTLTGVAGKTLTFNKSLTLDGTDSTTMTFPTTSATIARTDSAQTFTGVQTFTAPILGTPTSATLTNATGLPAAAVVAGALANGMTATTQSAGDSSTKLATTAYVDANPKIVAQVNWTGGGTTINRQFNVASITRGGSGDYTINLTAAIGANAVWTFGYLDTIQTGGVQAVTQTTTSMRITATNLAAAPVDFTTFYAVATI